MTQHQKWTAGSEAFPADRSVYEHKLFSEGTEMPACIDQLNIDASLTCLPIFLSGCKTLLMLVGSTYMSRLWVRHTALGPPVAAAVARV